MPEDVQELKPAEEVVTATPAVEGEKPTPSKDETTVVKSFSQKELDKAVGKGVSSIQSQLALKTAEIDKLTARLDSQDRVLQAKDQAGERLVQERFEGDPDGLQAWRDNEARKTEWERINAAKADLEEVKTAHGLEVWKATMEAEFQKAILEHEVPYEAVEECRNVESLWKIAKLFPKVEPENTATIKLDSAISGAVSTSGTTSSDKVTRGLEKLKKK